MTLGQKRAICELQRIQATSHGDFEFLSTSQLENGRIMAAISMRMGPMETKAGGLELREREDFILSIPPDFPFDYPTLHVDDSERYAKVPHVIWSQWICLYQSKLEWNPADGMYGFFDRFCKWLWKAAVNDLDPLDGPLEPPHSVTSFSQVPFVVRSNAPVTAGEFWYGVVELEEHPNRIELVRWIDMAGDSSTSKRLAFALILPESLPMQFPKLGKDLFKELEKQQVDQNMIIKSLAIASLFAKDDEPIHLVVGLPMRRASDGSPRIHVAVWSTPSNFSEMLRMTLPEKSDIDTIRSIRQDISDKIGDIFRNTEIAWCRVLEDRPEIVVRRDRGKPIEWFNGKKILVLGCGALGSWISEMLVRAEPKLLHILDNAIVKPGILTRQNYMPGDIGENKAKALAQRLKSVAPQLDIESSDIEAHVHLTETPEFISKYDIVIDCTASNIFQMKMERDWHVFKGHTPPIMSLITDSQSSRVICVFANPKSCGGIWDAYVQMKYHLCVQGRAQDWVSAFYEESAFSGLFQPEPGCSDPTFAGSMADVCGIAATALNITAEHFSKEIVTAVGVAFSAHSLAVKGEMRLQRFGGIHDVAAGKYRLRISDSSCREIRAWVRHSGRVRSTSHETGGLLWGLWDDVVRVIWIFDASGPPPDSRHGLDHFQCGTDGTSDEHSRRMKASHGTCGFVGFWHTHPFAVPDQSIIDIQGMAGLVSHIGQNQKRAVMFILGQEGGRPVANVYVYERISEGSNGDTVAVAAGQLMLEGQEL